MDDMYGTYRPQLGNMYTMLTIPPAEPRDDMQTLRDMVVEVVFNTIKTEYEIEENNRGLTVWTTVLGDFNKHGLRQYSTIKINEKNINKVRFNMNY
jgi:predicted mannosyl-3-phosphoglycerate phosphatase (HAD superfamily)